MQVFEQLFLSEMKVFYKQKALALSLGEGI